MAVSMPKRMIYASFAAVALVSIAAIADLVTKSPFGGSTTFDILFLIAGGIVAYLGWDALREMA